MCRRCGQSGSIKNDASSDYLEVFANSRAGQKIMLSGAGIATTQMIGTTGRGDLYYAKVLVPGNAPVEVVAKNETDGTSWTAPVTDLVETTAASYDLGTKTLTVNAHSSVASGVTLTAVPGGALLADGTLSVVVPSPPLNVVVKSSAGGRPPSRCGSSVPTSSRPASRQPRAQARARRSRSRPSWRCAPILRE